MGSRYTKALYHSLLKTILILFAMIPTKMMKCTFLNLLKYVLIIIPDKPITQKINNHHNKAYYKIVLWLMRWWWLKRHNNNNKIRKYKIKKVNNNLMKKFKRNSSNNNLKKSWKLKSQQKFPRQQNVRNYHLKPPTKTKLPLLGLTHSAIIYAKKWKMLTTKIFLPRHFVLIQFLFTLKQK